MPKEVALIVLHLIKSEESTIKNCIQQQYLQKGPNNIYIKNYKEHKTRRTNKWVKFMKKE
jgi:hypothetical protein